MTCVRIAPLIGLLCAVLPFEHRAAESAARSSFRSQTSSTLNVDVNLVLLNTTVMDSQNRHVTGLKKENFLVQFSNSPQLVAGFTNEISKIQDRLLLTHAQGMTSLYDALYLGLERVGRGNNPRKAILLITDGED